MKTLILIILLTITSFAQSSDMLLLMSGGDVKTPSAPSVVGDLFKVTVSTNETGVDSVLIYRDGVYKTTVASGSQSWKDSTGEYGVYTYTLKNKKGTELSGFSASASDTANAGFVYTGTNTGNITIQTSGAVIFDWGDGTINTYNSATDVNAARNYGSAGTRNVKIYNVGNLRKWYMSSNVGTFTGINTNYLFNITYLYLNNIGGKITVNTADVTSLTTLLLYSLNTGTISITVNTANIPSLTYLYLYNLNTGTISITVNTANIPSLTLLNLLNLYTGTRNITANPADITGNITYYRVDIISTGATVDLSYTTKTWANNQIRVSGIVSTGGLTSGELDQLLIDLANVTTWTGEKIVDFTGAGNQARTSASDTAVTTLQGKGVTVTTN